MVKKKIATIAVASALALGMGTAASAAPLNSSGVEQSQSASGNWSSLLNFQNKFTSGQSTKTSSAKGQSLFVRGSQTQVGKSYGPAEATQTQDIHLNLEDSTEVTGNQQQSTAVSSPSYLLQSQSAVSAASDFQASIEGGPTIQHSINHNFSFQYSSSIFKLKK